MSVSSDSDDASEASTRELIVGLARQWTVWLAVVVSVAIAGLALRPRSEAPEGYVSFFLAVAIVGVLYGVEPMSAAPNPRRIRTVRPARPVSRGTSSKSRTDRGIPLGPRLAGRLHPLIPQLPDPGRPASRPP